MHVIRAIMKKELRTYFVSPIAYVVITIFLVSVNWMFFFFYGGYFQANEASMRGFLELMPWIFLFLVPAITMRVWAEEKKLGTMELLMTFPVKDHEVVTGKFLGSFIFLVICISLTFTVPLTVAYTGTPDWGPVIGGYLGVLLMGTAYLSLGLFISSLTENQIIAFIISFLILFIFSVIGTGVVLFAVPKYMVSVLGYIGFTYHFQSISRGVIDSRDIVYYCSFILFFLYLNILSIGSRKW